MEFKGTKGVWSVVDATPVDSKNLQIKTDDLISVIDFERETIAICGRKEEVQIANAKLIAAAPEMFELLKETERIMSSLRLSMSAHPDCVDDSEFADYVTLADEQEIKIIELLTKITQ